jgi:hypothetical protein
VIHFRQVQSQTTQTSASALMGFIAKASIPTRMSGLAGRTT